MSEVKNTECSTPDCTRRVVARTLCRRHYLREWRTGQHEALPTRDRTKKICPPDCPHDLKCWEQHGCRCDRCGHLRKMERQRRRHRLTAYGRTEEFRPERVPAGPVRDHIGALMEYAGLERIADAAQVSRSYVLDIYFGPRGARKRRAPSADQTVRASDAARILAVTPDQIDVAMVAAVGTVRRLRALVAIGYTESELATRMGVLVSNLSPLMGDHRARVTSATYRTVLDLFAELWSQPVAGRSGDKARALAKRNGWVGPLAWDDIDNPDETPNVMGDAEDHAESLDETAIDMATAGYPVELTTAERREAVARLHAQRFSDSLIANRLAVDPRTVLRIRQTLGLEAVPQSELVNAGAR